MSINYEFHIPPLPDFPSTYARTLIDNFKVQCTIYLTQMAARQTLQIVLKENHMIDNHKNN